MKPQIIAAIISLVLPLSCTDSLSAKAATVAPEVIQSDWQDFASSEGKFKVQMPGLPTEEKEANEKGDIEHTFKLELQQEKAFYFIYYFDQPELVNASPDLIQQILTTTVKSFIEGAESKLVKEQDITINDYPGKAFEFDLEVGNTPPGQGQIYIVGKRLYALIAITGQPQDAQRFLNSFRLLEN